jgi:hypothetical protein
MIIVMVSKKKLLEIYHDTMREIYRCSTPAADWDKILKNPPKEKDWFDGYYIDDKTLVEIFDRNVKGKKIAKHQMLSLRESVFLGVTPTGNYKRWREYNGLPAD